MLTLIGSTAAKSHLPDFREPKDVDWHSSEPLSEKQRAALHGADVFVDERLGTWNWGPVATPEELYTMKVSHSYWEINRDPRNWDKHASDIIFFQRKGVEFIPELHDILVPIWKDLHSPNKTNLNQNKEAFFADAVNRKYDHDSVHRSVAYTSGSPLYELFLKEDSEVLSDWSKFDALDHDTKIRAVREEIYATALERIVIPKDYHVSPSMAYWWALRRTATSLFKNKWAQFLLLNLDELARPDMDYVSHHKTNNMHLIEL